MGVVYHANYLKYLERARWEYLDERTSGVLDYLERGYSFMVFKAEMVFHSPAKLGDLLSVRNLDREYFPISSPCETDHNKEGRTKGLFGHCHNNIRACRNRSTAVGGS